MAWTIANAINKAGLDGITAAFNGGSVDLSSSAPAVLANVGLNATAFGGGTTAAPSVASANATTPDTSITAGTIVAIAFKNSGGTTLINGSVGVGSGDFQVADNVIPGSATSVDIAGLQFTLLVS